MEHLLSVWPEVAKQLRDARHILLLTDYDGTLTPIVERPELANLSEDTRRLLQDSGTTAPLYTGDNQRQGTGRPEG